MCRHLESIILPKSIKSIKNATFYDCESLTSIDIPTSVTAIEKFAFGECCNIPSKIKSDIIQRFGKEVFEYL